MSDVVKHKFTSAVADGPDATKLRPSNWNDEHAFAGGTAGQFLTRDTGASDGATWATPALSASVSVKQFGAVGDGVTDATAAIQAAHDALPSTGGRIVAPAAASFYLLTGSGVTLSKPVLFVGEGSGQHLTAGATTFRYTGTTQAFKITGTTRSSIELAHLQIDGNSNGNHDVIGIDINGPSSVVLRDVHVRRVLGEGPTWFGKGVRIYAPADGQSHFVTLESCYLHANGIGLYLDGAGSGNPPNGPVLLNTRIVSSASHGLKIALANTVGLLMNGGELAFNGGSGAVINGSRHTFIGVDIEGNTAYGIDTTTGTDVGVTAINCPGLAGTVNGTLTLFVDVGGIAIGGTGTVTLKKYLTATATWDPASLADGATAQVEVPLTGAVIGDPAWVGLTSLTTIMHLTAHAFNDVIKVVLTNRSGGTVDLGSGTLRVGVWKH